MSQAGENVQLTGIEGGGGSGGGVLPLWQQLWGDGVAGGSLGSQLRWAPSSFVPPISTAHCALSAPCTGTWHNHQKSPRLFHLLRLKKPSGMGWGNEAVKDTEEEVPLGVKVLSIHSSYQH